MSCPKTLIQVAFCINQNLSNLKQKIAAASHGLGDFSKGTHGSPASQQSHFHTLRNTDLGVVWESLKFPVIRCKQSCPAWCYSSNFQYDIPTYPKKYLTPHFSCICLPQQLLSTSKKTKPGLFSTEILWNTRQNLGFSAEGWAFLVSYI